ncbi:unknown protein [Microcystis aeruginosa NIES-843]|uniref:Uncharacterized protein n=1 Tax=Microcystis aeruginosa (strain NIES-843 / IAM M-2473) TaxID=449447 RepID=B0JVF1_MICAN|nr:unknown protein [Microcystis aeruginosa NIES-843]
MLEKGFGLFLPKKCQKQTLRNRNRDSKPWHFCERWRRVPLCSTRGHSVILTSPTDDRLGD